MNRAQSALHQRCTRITRPSQAR